MSLEARRNFFDILSQRLNCKKVNDLMLEIRLEKKLFDNLYKSTFNYITRCINAKTIINSEKQLFGILKKKQSKKYNSKRDGCSKKRGMFRI